MPRRLISCVHGPLVAYALCPAVLGVRGVNCSHPACSARSRLVASTELGAHQAQGRSRAQPREGGARLARAAAGRGARRGGSSDGAQQQRAFIRRYRSPLHEVDTYMQPRRAAAAGDLGAGPRPPVHAARRSEAAPRLNAALFAPSSARRRRPRPPRRGIALEVEPGTHAPVVRYKHEPRPLLARSPARRRARRPRGGCAGIRLASGSHPARCERGLKLVGRNQKKDHCV